MTEEMMRDIADQVAKYWLKKGIKSYSYEEMLQDAAEVVLYAAKRHDPRRGDLRGYCFWAARNAVWHRATMAMAAVTCRGNGRDTTLGVGTTRVKQVQSEDDIPRKHRLGGAVGAFPISLSAEYLDDCAWRGQVRLRVLQLLRNVKDAEIGVEALLHAGDGGLKMMKDRGFDHARIRTAIARVRRRLQGDLVLYKLLRNA